MFGFDLTYEKLYFIYILHILNFRATREIMSITALQTYLAPFEDIFNMEGVSEISINGLADREVGEVWVEQYGDMHSKMVDGIDARHLRSLALLIAQSTEQMISEEAPLLSATLPQGYRVQVVFPPACADSGIAFSIRKQTIVDFDLDKYEALGAFQSTEVVERENPVDIELQDMLDKGNIKNFLIKALLAKKNIVISGGTSTGKTTFMNALLKELPKEERIITCEDAREIMISHIPNRVHLLASKGGQGRAKITTQDLIEACLRLRPDRIIVGELRGAEAYSFLRAVNTGHPGSISTLHADTPKLAFEQLSLMVMQAGLNISKKEIKDYVKNVVNVVVQLKRSGGKRFVSEVYFDRG